MRWLLVLVLASGCSCGGGNSWAESNFDNDDEGWTLSPDATSTTPELRATGGAPGGHICGKDGEMSDIWYFSAPEKFLHDASTTYGKRLTWSLKQESTFQQVKGRDVILQGNGVALVWNIKTTPGKDWTEFGTRIDDTSGWKKDEDPAFPDATEEEMRTALRNVTVFKIRGEYKDGPDFGCLDNVHFGTE
jgi:alkaline phosphatase D